MTLLRLMTDNKLLSLVRYLSTSVLFHCFNENRQFINNKLYIARQTAVVDASVFLT